MNADQIAAEAARDIFTRYLELKGMFREEDALPFIKSAIEKATDTLRRERDQQERLKWEANKRAAEAESRAHASEPWTLATWDKSWAKSHEDRGQMDVWSIKCGNKTIVDHLSKKVCQKLIDAHNRAAHASEPLDDTKRLENVHRAAEMAENEADKLRGIIAPAQKLLNYIDRNWPGKRSERLPVQELREALGRYLLLKGA